MEELKCNLFFVFLLFFNKIAFAYGANKKPKARKDSFSSDEDERDKRGFASNKLGFKYI
jgi:hypothetical protein